MKRFRMQTSAELIAQGKDPNTHNTFGQPIKPRPYVPPAETASRHTYSVITTHQALVTVEEIIVRRTTTVSYPAAQQSPVIPDGAYPSPLSMSDLRERPVIRQPAVYHVHASQSRAPGAVWAIVISASLIGLGTVIIVMAFVVG